MSGQPCPVCAHPNAQIFEAIVRNDRYKIDCPDCGPYEVCGTVMDGGGGFKSQEDEDRQHALHKAKRRTKDGSIPLIDSRCVSHSLP